MREFISVEEARAEVLAAVTAQPVERLPLAAALGRTLAAPVVSREDIPPFANSAMDGFAVRAADVQAGPVVLRVVEDLPAGRMPERVVTAGTCARIMTGAPVPEGADAVVPVEDTAPAGEGTVRILKAVPPGRHVRGAGEDVRAGEAVLPAGAVVTPPVVGLLATLGYAEVAVRVPPRVAVIATGDELVPPAQTPGPGQIRNANGPSLAAQAVAAGAVALPPLHAPDDPGAIRRTVEQALAADVLVFSGGVSVGDYDYVKQVLDEMGLTLRFWKVRQRPGKPLAFGLLKGKPVFGLPGNPVSSAVCFDQYVRPALAAMLGRATVLRPRYRARLTTPMKKVAGLHFFARGVAATDDAAGLTVRGTGPQGSNIYTSMVRANCLVHLPEALDQATPGTLVDIEWLDW